jgi:hypothetical protein
MGAALISLALSNESGCLCETDAAELMTGTRCFITEQGDSGNCSKLRWQNGKPAKQSKKFVVPLPV